jgi:hypothetical protein
MISIPFRHDCSENVSDYKLAVQAYREAMFGLEPVRIELGYVEYLRPFGLNLLAGITYDLLRRGLEVSIAQPKAKRVEQFLMDHGFFKEFLISTSGRVQQVPRSTSVGLRRLDELDGTYLSSMVYWLNRHALVSREHIEDMVMVTMPEILNNVFDHSQSTFGCYVCAEAYPKESRLMLSVMDFGIGFFQQLSPHYHQLTNDSDAIALAVQEGVTSKTTMRNAGRGLPILSGWIKTHNGDLEIISIDGQWTQDRSGSTRSGGVGFDFPGSCINLCVHTDGIEAGHH